MCLVRSTSRIGVKAPPSILSSNPLDRLLFAQLYTYVLAKILQYGAKFIQKLTTGFKHNIWNLDNFMQVVKVKKVEILWATFVQKIDFFS